MLRERFEAWRLVSLHWDTERQLLLLALIFTCYVPPSFESGCAANLQTEMNSQVAARFNSSAMLRVSGKKLADDATTTKMVCSCPLSLSTFSSEYVLIHCLSLVPFHPGRCLPYGR